jgi:hypothetical protein
VNDFRGTVKHSQSVEFCQEILISGGFAGLHPDQAAQRSRTDWDSDPMSTRDFLHRLESQAPLKMTVEIHLGQAFIKIRLVVH